MSSKYTPHLQVLPEDDENRQFVSGAELNPRLRPRQLQVLPPAGGWMHVLNRLSDPATVQGLANHGLRHLLLLIDFDDDVPGRWAIYQNKLAALPAGVARRVDLLGCLHEPEKLKAALRYRHTVEALGRELSDDCAPAPAANRWQHQHLVHNAAELARLAANVAPFLLKP